MDSLPSTFIIEIDGRPISKVNGPMDEWDGQSCKLVEGGSEPAVFELRESRLMSEGHVLSRHFVEDLSLRPKRVLWFKPENRYNEHRVVAEKNGDDYSLTISGCPLMVRDGIVVADIMRQEPSRAIVKMR